MQMDAKSFESAVSGKLNELLRKLVRRDSRVLQVVFPRAPRVAEMAGASSSSLPELQ